MSIAYIFIPLAIIAAVTERPALHKTYHKAYRKRTPNKFCWD